MQYIQINQKRAQDHTTSFSQNMHNFKFQRLATEDNEHNITTTWNNRQYMSNKISTPYFRFQIQNHNL